MCNCLCSVLPLFVYVSVLLFVFQTYHLNPFLLYISQSSFSPPLSAHPPPFLISPTFLFFLFFFPSKATSPLSYPPHPPPPPTHPHTLMRVPALARAAEVPLSQCAAGPAMKMCSVWHSWNESPNRRGSGYHRAPPGPGSVCLTLIMAHANECAPLKWRESCLPPCLGLRAQGLCVSARLCFCFCAR